MEYFQPSFKLVEKSREGARLTKRFLKPATPCDRLLEHPEVSFEVKDMLREQRAELVPVALLHTIREARTAPVALSSPDGQPAHARESLEQFLSRLPELWRFGEVGPTHAARSRCARTRRTRKDLFEGVWPDVLFWLQQDPDATAKELFERLTSIYPDRFTDAQLRTLQRRVREWRTMMARELVYASLDVSWPLKTDRSGASLKAQIPVTSPDEATPESFNCR